MIHCLAHLSPGKHWAWLGNDPFIDPPKLTQIVHSPPLILVFVEVIHHLLPYVQLYVLVMTLLIKWRKLKIYVDAQWNSAIV